MSAIFPSFVMRLIYAGFVYIYCVQNGCIIMHNAQLQCDISVCSFQQSAIWSQLLSKFKNELRIDI